MSYQFRIELFLVAVTTVLGFILFLKLFHLLRSNLVWRVNCWFCNNYFWVSYNERNCWTCPNCEQYNGFNKDGDYNKTIFAVNESSQKSPKAVHRSPPKNGLCKMCNINQELKVAQLANFVPTSERKYEDEIEMYRVQLEKAYKLCSSCKKVLQMKLHKEKETLLGTKLIESRTPENKCYEKQETSNTMVQKLINNTSMVFGCLILVLVTVECYQNVKNDKDLSISLRSTVEIITGLLKRLFSIMQMKLDIKFPVIEHLYDFNIFYIDFTSKMDKLTISHLNQYNLLSQGVLGGCICILQIIGHVFNSNKMKYAIIIDFLWTVFMVVTMAHHSLHIAPITISLIKFLSVSVTILVYKSIKTKASSKKKITNNTASNRKLTAKKLKLLNYNEDNTLMDTDDDVSLSKFGLHNITDSSNETASPFNNSFSSGRCFTPRSDSIWSKPKLNNTFCINSLLTKTKTPSLISETVFAKPSFEKYQKLIKDDSDSDLDESISSLTIGTPKKPKHKNNSIFSLRKFTATPNFVAPTPLSRRPLISPSKLGHSTSWVAGGYWGSEGERPMFTLNGSRSSSQSSGFESQASSMNQRNIFSHPPSREESVCGDPDRASALLDPFQSCNINNNVGRYMSPRNFSRVSSPIYPQMQYNGHVHIPQPRFAQHTQFPNQGMFARQQTFVQNSLFKSGAGTINYSAINSFNHQS